jgi:ABC-type antimicrobial peptide transport system permease subunit
MASIGVAVGVAAGWAGARVVASLLQQTQLPGLLPIAGAALVLLAAAVVASFVPAARAARVDVMQALRSE